MKRILIIGGEETIKGIRAIFRKSEYILDYAPNQDEYKRRIGKEDYVGVIIPELRVPGENATIEEPCMAGFEVIEDLSKRGIPVLAISGDSPYINKKAMDLGARVLRMPTIPFEKIFSEFQEMVGDKIK